MRAFLAVHPGERLTATLSSRLDPWRGRLPLRWTRPETWHLTLQFLGEWPEARLEALQAACDAFEPGPPFAIAPGGLGAFPQRRRPRVLFLQLEGDGRVAQLADRVRAITGEVWAQGPRDDKPFRGHLTLARVGDPLGEQDLKLIDCIDLSGLPPMEVEGFSLMVSQPGPRGVSHRQRCSWPMRKKGE